VLTDAYLAYLSNVKGFFSFIFLTNYVNPEASVTRFFKKSSRDTYLRDELD